MFRSRGRSRRLIGSSIRLWLSLCRLQCKPFLRTIGSARSCSPSGLTNELSEQDTYPFLEGPNFDGGFRRSPDALEVLR
jgi:hypothetical protein